MIQIIVACSIFVWVKMFTTAIEDLLRRNKNNSRKICWITFWGRLSKIHNLIVFVIILFFYSAIFLSDDLFSLGDKIKNSLRPHEQMFQRIVLLEAQSMFIQTITFILKCLHKNISQCAQNALREISRWMISLPVQ